MSVTGEHPTVSIEADPEVPIIRITCDFDATPAQLLRAHTDPELFVRWVGPDGMETEILDWEATSGGRWRYVSRRDGQEYGFRGCFHDVRDDRIVQTVSFWGSDDVALEKLWFEDLGDGPPACTRSRSWTASRPGTSGSPAAWRSVSSRVTRSSRPCSQGCDGRLGHLLVCVSTPTMGA